MVDVKETIKVLLLGTILTVEVSSSGFCAAADDAADEIAWSETVKRPESPNTPYTAEDDINFNELFIKAAKKTAQTLTSTQKDELHKYLGKKEVTVINLINWMAIDERVEPGTILPALQRQCDEWHEVSKGNSKAEKLLLELIDKLLYITY